jgi:hypothetical protein
MDSPVSIQYLAGLFDGEGTITLTKRHKQDIFRTPVLQLPSTTYKLVEICKQAFGGCICTKKVYQAHHKPSWQWQLNGDGAIETTRQLLPYIQEPEKARRMQLVLTVYKSITPRNGRYTPELIKAKHSFESEFFHPSNTIATP